MGEIDIHIRRASGLKDYLAAVDLQKEVWRDDAHLATLPMLLLADKWGGCVLVAEAADNLIGFSFAILAREHEKIFWWSHMTAIKPEFRNKGVGRQLKLHQREQAIACGIDEIHWTFDPLQAINAHFNIHKLGAIARRYEENVYGVSNSPLHQGLPTDRFIAEWYLRSDRVLGRTGIENPPVILRDIDRLPRINALGNEVNLRLEDTFLLLEVPIDIASLKQTDLEQARAWQAGVRAAAKHYFAAGYAATDFILLRQPSQEAFYVLERTAVNSPTGGA
jgi:predicted GNAT superfamily acetyltransferase